MLRVLPIALLLIILTAYILTPAEDNEARQQQLRNLTQHYERSRESNDYDTAFIYVRAIVLYLVGNNKHADAIAFLGRHIRSAPDDKKNAYYLFLIATQYVNQHAPLLAQTYYLRAIHAPDVYIKDVSVHYQSLLQLIQLEEKPHYKIRYLTQLLESFPDEIQNTSLLYHTLGENYIILGEWQEAYEAYKTFLRLAYNRRKEITLYPVIEQWTDLYDSNRDWTVGNLDLLVSSVKDALYTKSIAKLLRFRAKKNFFTMSWNQKTFDQNTQIKTFNIGAFLRRSTVRFNSALERSSNNKEAYLRTWGWSHRIPVWYFYFRKIEFEADPSINGNWEWAGIFFGDSL